MSALHLAVPYRIKPMRLVWTRLAVALLAVVVAGRRTASNRRAIDHLADEVDAVVDSVSDVAGGLLDLRKQQHASHHHAEALARRAKRHGIVLALVGLLAGSVVTL